MTRLCKVWQKISPAFSSLKKLDYPTSKALVIQYKWRILIVVLVLFAGSKAYDYFFPPSGKAGAVQTITSIVTEKICRWQSHPIFSAPRPECS